MFVTPMPYYVDNREEGDYMVWVRKYNEERCDGDLLDRRHDNGKGELPRAMSLLLRDIIR